MSFLSRNLVICLCLGLSTVVGSSQQLTPFNSDYAIAGSLPGDQSHCDAAVGTSGGILVWEQNSDPLGLRVVGCVLDSTFQKTGSAFPLSLAKKSKTLGDQERPQVALAPNGAAVVIWQGGVRGNQQILASCIGPGGALIKKDILISTFKKSDKSTPRIAALADGSFVVVWCSFSQDGDRLGVYGQRISAAGQKLGKEFPVNEFRQNNQRSPAVAALADGGFVVAWVSEMQRAPNSVDIYARIFGATGAARTSEFPVNTSIKPCASPSIAGSLQSPGEFLVAWSQNDTTVSIAGMGNANGTWVSAPAQARSTNSWDVAGRVFSGVGEARSDAFYVNSRRYGDQYASQSDSRGIALLRGMDQPGAGWIG